MDRKDRPTGREKQVGSGSGKVEKRGDGIGRGDAGPVGGPGGFFGRSRESGQTGAPQSGGSGPNRKTPGGMGKILGMLVVIAVVFMVSKMGGGGINLPLTQTGQQTNNLGNQTGAATYDQGAYAVNRTVSEQSRAKRTHLLGSGQDRVTIMVYLLGTDLESRSGMATMDLQEMLNAKLSDKVNIIFETGGTSQWKNEIMSRRTNQRYRLSSQGLIRLEADLGRKSMVSPDTLSDFIRYSKTNFPAERYFLLFWDHGGGSVTGYGYDEYFKGDTMTLAEIAKALANAGCQFDLVGFDACLMATLETAMVVEPYADYLIASEELEPGIGWYYTGWLNELSQNTSIATIDLGKKLIDDYIQEVKKQTPKSQATLSLVDLAELRGTTPEPFSEFAQSTSNLIETENYKKVSDSRAAAKEFAASSKINQIDLIDFAKKLGTPPADAFTKVLQNAIKYNRMTDNIVNANGLSIYFPYGKLSDVSSALDTYAEIGMDNEYARTIKSFANLNAGGQMASTGGGIMDLLLGSSLTGGSGGSGGSAASGISSDLIETLLNTFISQGDFSAITGGIQQAPKWFNAQQVTQSAQYYSQNMLDPAKLVISTKNGKRVLDLSEQEWDQVHTMELSVFVNDGKGYIDLGRDNVFEYNSDGDLLLEYDGTWLALNGQIVSYYMTSHDAHDNTYKILGRVPAMLNGQRVDIILSFDPEKPHGEVLGARIVYDQQTETPNLPKGLIEIKPGDRIDYLCDYYSYQGEFNDTYYLGEPYFATGNWQIENLAITNLNYLMTYKITDIYGNSHWTPVITGHRQ